MTSRAHSPDNQAVREGAPLRAMIVCEDPTTTPDLIAVARALQDRGNVSPVVILGNAPCGSLIKGADTHSIVTKKMYIDSLKESATTQGAGDRSGIVRRNLPHVLKRGVRGPVQFWSNFRAMNRWRLEAGALLREFEPQCVVVASDRVPTRELAILAEGRRTGAANVLVPMSPTDPDSLAHFRHRQDGFRVRWLSKPLAWLLRGQARVTPYGQLFFFSVPRMIAYTLLRVLPPQPWCLGGGRVDVVCVAGAKDERNLISYGLDERKIRVTGRASLDSLHDSWQQRGTRRRQLEQESSVVDEQVIICAVPHLAEHGLASWVEQERDIRWLVGELSATGRHVLLSLHPKSKRGSYEVFATTDNVTIADAPLREILAAADVFVATVSGTLRWAALLGLPSVVLNHYGLDEKALDDVPGLYVVRDKKELRPCLDQVLSKDRADSSGADGAANREFDLFDGNSAERIASIIEEQAVRVGGAQN